MSLWYHRATSSYITPPDRIGVIQPATAITGICPIDSLLNININIKTKARRSHCILFNCEVKNRHVTSVNYDGPEPERMGTAEKLAVGAAAAIAAGLVASEMSKDDEEKVSEKASEGHSSTHAVNPSFDTDPDSIRVIGFEAPTQLSDLTGLYLELASSQDILLEAPET